MSLPQSARSIRSWVRNVVAVGAVVGCCPLVNAAPLPFVHGKGAIVVDDAGKQLTLRGCNLGNWLVIESWMVGWQSDDQETLIKTFRDRFGVANADRLMDLYRDGYIRPRDFDLIKSFGFNIVRVPFDSRMLIDEHGVMRPDAFKWLDRALDMAEGAGVYVILDMHGGPGSQSIQDHTGQSGQNKLWSDPTNQTHMADLWKHIAERYKSRSVVAAYDVLNEPYGDFHSDMRANLKELMPRCYAAIRASGDKHLVIFPNALGGGVTFYDDPKSAGMEQVAFTDHYYAGLFGSPSTIASHAETFLRTMPEAQTFLDRVGCPMLIGEFNVVLEKAGGKPMMRKYYDEFARRGWMATMWSYKSLKPAAGVQGDNWYMTTNADALPTIDMKTSSLQDIEAYLKKLPTMSLAVDDKLRLALTSPTAPPMTLPALDPLPSAAPKIRASGDWKLIDVGTALPAGVAGKDAKLSLIAAGTDIFGGRDGFGFLQQPAPETAVLSVRVDHLAESDSWAKSGLMIRFGDPSGADYAAAPFVMVNTFPDGGVAFVTREKAGATASEVKRAIGPLPRKIALVRDGDRVDGYADNGADGWVKLGSATIATSVPARIGMVACSHHDHLFTQADFAEVFFDKAARLTGNVTPDANVKIAASVNTNSLKNAGFDAAEKDGAPTAWNRWGDRFLARSSTLVWSGSGTDGNGGLWQDVAVVPGKQYEFKIRAHGNGTTDRGPDLSLSIESTVDGKQVSLADKGIDIRQLEGSGGWSVFQMHAGAISDRMRILIRATPPAGEPAADITLDDATFTEVRP